MISEKSIPFSRAICTVNPRRDEKEFRYFPEKTPTRGRGRLRVGEEEQRNERAPFFLQSIKNRSKRYAACSDVVETEGFEAPQAALRARMSPLAPAAARRNRSGMTKGSNPPMIKTAPAKSRCRFYGGDGGIRTLDLTDANRTLSQIVHP